MALCERCSQPYDPPLNRPAWALCVTCTLSPIRGSAKRQGATPGYALPPPTPNSVTFIVPGKPMSVNDSFVSGQFRHTKEARSFKANVATHAYNALGPYKHTWDKSRQFTIRLIAYFANPRADSDNIIKPVKDALQDKDRIRGSGVLYFNDNQVISDHTEKLLDPVAPRLVVTVEAVP